MTKEYLYHGSPKKLEKLIPNQACDTGFKEKFVHAMGTQWVCYEEIVPEKIIEIEVDDYLDLCVIE